MAIGIVEEVVLPNLKSIKNFSFEICSLSLRVSKINLLADVRYNNLYLSQDYFLLNNS